MAPKNVSVGVCNERYKALKEDVGEIKGDVKVMKDNHLVHLQKGLNEVKEIVVGLQVEHKLIKWLVPILLGFLTASITLLVGLARG